MMTSWMLQFAVVSGLLALGATAVERLLRLWRKQARLVWAVAIAASLVLPVVSLAHAAGLIPSLPAVSRIPVLPTAPIRILVPREPDAHASRVDLAIAIAWLVTSLGLTIRFAVVSRALARRRATWRAAVLDGQRLLISEDAGPAVIGIRKPTVVVPQWVLGLDRSLRALVLRHEREHLDRGDPRLLVGAVAATTLAPWNLILWFQLHRLRSAMELDCDLRVLRVHPDARRYGSLLLAVAQRGDRGELLAAALTESNSLLGRRITAMRRPISSFRVTQTLLLATSAILATVVACEMQTPSAPAKPPVKLEANAAYFEFQVEKPVEPAAGSSMPRYPDALRKAGVEGEVLAQFIVGPDGTADVESFKVLKTSHALFTQAVRAALPSMRFRPALVGGRPVKQLVQQPFSFSVSK